MCIRILAVFLALLFVGCNSYNEISKGVFIDYYPKGSLKLKLKRNYKYKAIVKTSSSTITEEGKFRILNNNLILTSTCYKISNGDSLIIFKDDSLNIISKEKLYSKKSSDTLFFYKYYKTHPKAKKPRISF